MVKFFRGTAGSLVSNIKLENLVALLLTSEDILILIKISSSTQYPFYTFISFSPVKDQRRARTFFLSLCMRSPAELSRGRFFIFNSTLLLSAHYFVPPHSQLPFARAPTYIYRTHTHCTHPPLPPPPNTHALTHLNTPHPQPPHSFPPQVGIDIGLYHRWALTPISVISDIGLSLISERPISD